MPPQLNFQIRWGVSQCFDPDCGNEMSSLWFCSIESMFQVTLDFRCLLCQAPSVCSLSNWLRPQVNWTLSWRMNIEPGCISPCCFDATELHSPGELPLPCSGFHRPAPHPHTAPLFRYRDLFHKRLMDKKHVRKQLCSTVRWVRPLFIIRVYIFSIKKCYVVDECSVWLLLEWNKKYSLGDSDPTQYTQSPLGIILHSYLRMLAVG